MHPLRWEPLPDFQSIVYLCTVWLTLLSSSHRISYTPAKSMPRQLRKDIPATVMAFYHRHPEAHMQ